jgi:cephalosporin hydroxylase
MSTWQNIEGSMFNFQNYYDKIARELPDKCRVVEVGVANGKSAVYLAEKLHELGKDFTMYFVDNMDYGGADQLNTIIQSIVNSGLGSKIQLMARSSLDAAAKFNDNYLDFVFLDSSHEFLPTKAEITLWWTKVKHQCCISGHDYQLYPGVKDAVDILVPRVKIYSDELGTFDSLEIYNTDDHENQIFEIRKHWQAKLKWDE